MIAAIDSADLSPFKFQGWEGNRLTQSYGSTYDFETGRASDAHPIPEWLNPFKERAEAFAGMPSGSIVQVLVIRYDPGAGIGWHKDRPMFGRVVGISLGSEATMRFRQRTDRGFDRVSLPLVPREAYLLGGIARSEWEHSIAAVDYLR